MIGLIEQDWSICKPSYSIKNAAGDDVLKIKGPRCTFSICGDIKFQLMSVMGSNLRSHTLSWFIATTAEMLINCSCIAAVLNQGLPNTDVSLLLFLLFVFGISLFAFCYLQLCKQLEGCQHELGFKSYSMNCCSLEQVFFNICQRPSGLRGIELGTLLP